MRFALWIWMSSSAPAAEQVDHETTSKEEPVEICNNLDDDGDGKIDEGCVESSEVAVADSDLLASPVKTTKITESPLEGSEIDPFPPLDFYLGQLVRGLPDSSLVHGWHVAEIGASSGDLPESLELVGAPGERFGSSLASSGSVLAVGAPGADRAYLFDDGVAMATLQGAAGAGGSVGLGDFDGDGSLDAAVGSAGGVAVAFGPLDGTVDLGPELASGSRLATGDWNADGLTDLAVAGPWGVDVFVGPSLALEVSLPPIASSLAFGDVDGDGADDLVVGDQGWDVVEVYLGGPTADMWADRTYWGDAYSGTGASVAVDPARGLFVSASAYGAITHIPFQVDGGPVMSPETSTRWANGVFGVGQLLAADIDGEGATDVSTAAGAVAAVNFRE